MPTTRLPLTLTSLGLLALASASCSGGSADKVLGANPAFVTLEEGVNLSAAPDTIILNPNDEAAPRDPVTMELIGSSTITALILDASLDSVSGADVTFSADAGTLASGGAPLVTDDNGQAMDTLAVTESGPREINVTGVSGAFTKTLAVVVDIALNRWVT